MGSKVDGMARRLYWKERKRALKKGSPRGDLGIPGMPDRRRELEEVEQEGQTTVESAESLDREQTPPVTPEEEVGWAKESVELPSPADEMEDGWLHSRKLPEVVGQRDLMDKERCANTASIWRFARKLMAREWRRALNKPEPNEGLAFLEEEAARIREEIDEEKLRKMIEDEAVQRAERQVSMMADAMRDIADDFPVGGREADALELADKVIGAAADVGYVLDVEWGSETCEIWLEPWEERKLRRIRRRERPVIYHIGISEGMEVVLRGIFHVDALPGEISAGGIKEVEGSLAPGTRLLELGVGEEPLPALEKRLSELGRVCVIEQDEDGWRAELEPWMEVRERRLRGIRDAGNRLWVLEIGPHMVVMNCSREVVE
jgi:hypothetical protein